MGACPAGAEPKPGAAGVYQWISIALSALTIWTPLKAKIPSIGIGLGQSLISVDEICASNPDPPEPFTAADAIEAALTIHNTALFSQSNVARKAWAWLEYEAFLASCQCKLPPPAPGANCWAVPSFTFSNPEPDELGPVSVPLDPAIPNSWLPTGVGGQISMQSSITFTSLSGASTELHAKLSFGSDITKDVRFHLPADAPGGQALHVVQNVPANIVFPGPSVRPSLELINIPGPVALTNFAWCFEQMGVTPPALPVQPPIGTPDAPVLVCNDADICAILTNLNQRFSILAGQVSDIQASITGRSVYRELSRTTVSGEGEINLVLGTRAVSLELTALSQDAFTSALGRPRGLMRVGSIRYGDGIGYSPRRFIDADRFDDNVPAGALSLSWQLLPNATAILKFLG